MRTFFAVLALAFAALPACVPPAHSGYPATTGYAYGNAAAPAGTPDGNPAAPPSAGGPAVSRNLRFNGRALDVNGVQVVAQLEAQYQTRLPDGDYWYDPRSGAAGTWGGPAAAVLPAGLPLGGALPPNASGGGQGQLTGVFVNGRELHPQDVAGLRTFTQVQAGRYWVDGQGNGGWEGGPAVFNLYAMARQASARGGGNSHYMKDSNGSIWVGGGGFSSSWKSDSGTTSNSCSYDPSDGAGVMCSKTSN